MSNQESNQENGGYGIGRIPADSDATSEALAELEAQEIERQQQQQRENQQRQIAAITGKTRTARNWQCSACGTHAVYLPLFESGAMGSTSLCAACWLDRQQQMTASAVSRCQTVDEALAWYRADAAREAAEDHICERCGRRGATWKSGAGAYLCARDWDNY